jgi:phosphatidylserine/phosphatidylglycerophosphate/cardiolipin synthase-like enzyme
MYHAMTMAVDDARVIVGSANCDHRSFRLNEGREKGSELTG